MEKQQNHKLQSWRQNADEMENILLSLSPPFSCHLTMDVISLGKQKIIYCTFDHFGVSYFH